MTRFAALVGGTVLVAAAGYGGFLAFASAGGPPAFGAAVIGLAVAAGVASFFAPCSFPLLLAMLGRRSRRRPVAIALGATLFLASLGVIIALIGSALESTLAFASPSGRAIRLAAGSMLLVLGAFQAELLTGRIFAGVEAAAKRAMPSTVPGEPGSFVGSVAFGFFYLLAGAG